MDLERLKTITFGFPQSQWDAANREAREQLVTVAKRAGTLASKIKSISFEADDDAFHKMLEQISIEEDAAGRGMLTVLVVHKGQTIGGYGFHIYDDGGARWITIRYETDDAAKKARDRSTIAGPPARTA